jgi:hypothetical protein
MNWFLVDTNVLSELGKTLFKQRKAVVSYHRPLPVLSVGAPANIWKVQMISF